MIDQEDRPAVELRQMAIADLRQEWVARIGEPVPKLSRDLLARAIAYQRQEQAEGGLRPAACRHLRRLVAERVTKRITGSIVQSMPTAGTRLVREWNGKIETVEVVANGYVWRDKTYRSLSVIARQITGTRWSGPRFFGLVRSATIKAS